ncbi:hypothetical protein NDU88_007542 [Pleurodeles waltl]|uniref:Uncharacterized protein n=1 Tax=Pleurodeles waltl TaxID=8319 RepID=A0AAV7PLL7_PLEWA|nr:hypothetical protein NDU88_007542 [Pleurodeles waltl]
MRCATTEARRQHHSTGELIPMLPPLLRLDWELCETVNYDRGISKDFYDPEDLRLFLDRLQPQTMDTSTTARPQRTRSDNRSASSPPTTKGGTDQRESDHRL